jgi:Spy/CpxP family protein refolding chaperone
VKSTIGLAITIIILMTGLVFADAAEDWADKHIETINKELKLSSGQKDQIRPILIEEFNKRQEARAERQEARTEKSEHGGWGDRENREEWYDKVHKRIGFILDDRQNKKLKKMEFINDWSGDEQLKTLTEKLNLTEDQQGEIAKILETSNNDRKILMDEMRSGSRDRSDMREAMQSINEETDKNIEAVLNAEQIKEYQKIKDERRSQMEQRRGGMGDGQNRRMGGGH